MIVPTLCAHRYTQVRKTRKTGPKRKYLTECIPRGRRLAGDGVSSVTDRSLQKKHRRQAASHSPWSQQDSGITLSTGMGMIGVPEITLIVPLHSAWECLPGRSASDPIGSAALTHCPVAGSPSWSFFSSASRRCSSVGSLILYQATYSAGRNSSVSKVAMMMPPIIA